MKIVYISASPFTTTSDSNKLGTQLVEKLGGEVVRIDLSSENIPYLTQESLAYSYGYVTPENASKETKMIDETRRAHINILKQADIVVVSSPMWNFGVPAKLKAYIDLVSYPKETFEYTAAGPVGLLPNISKVYAVTSTGGVYEGDMAALDHTGPYIEQVFSFLGAKSTQTVSISGMTMGTDEEKNERRKAAQAQIDALTV